MIEKTQCPFKKGKYRCKYGKMCTEDSQKTLNEMPSEWNECSVAQRQLNGNPWKNEKPVEWYFDHFQRRKE